MNRIEFLKSFGLSASGLFLPKGLIKERPIKIYDNYIKGLTHYNYPKLSSSIKEGDTLTLHREPENKYDRFAISIQFNEFKSEPLQGFTFKEPLQGFTFKNPFKGSEPLKGFYRFIEPLKGFYRFIEPLKGYYRLKESKPSMR